MHVPLFPLNTVLFPGMSIPLHIFEERYTQMVALCLREGLPFGVVLIKAGPEVGGPAVPHDIGTLARIRQHQHLDDGRYNIVATGLQRFEIIELDRSLPYLSARIAILPEERGESAGMVELVANVAETFREYSRLILALRDQWAAAPGLADDPAALSHVVAGRLELPNEERQHLLEAPTALDRLQRLKKHLEEAVLDLSIRMRAHYQAKFGSFGSLS